MNLIVAVDDNWAIGFNNRLLYHIPADKAFFKEKTTGKTVIMGKNTYNSLPDGKPLPNRKNIVLSTTLQDESCTCCRSKEELWDELSGRNTEDIFLIGGEMLYKEFFRYCKIAYVTKILKKAEPADRFCPNLDSMPDWKLREEGKIQKHEDIYFQFCTYYNDKADYFTINHMKR